MTLHRDMNYTRGLMASLIVQDLLTTLSGPEKHAWWQELSPRGMRIRELRNVHITLTDVSRCATWLNKRALNYPFMVGEWLWIQSGREDREMINYYCNEIGKFSDNGRIFFGAYGPRWLRAMSEIIPLLRRDEDTRQAVAGIWRPEVYDISFNTKDVPCTLSMQYFIRAGLVESTVVMRSSDVWLGLPYDLFNFSMLQRAVARALGRMTGPLTVFIGSCHLYERDLPRAREVVNANLNNTPSAPLGLIVPPPPSVLASTEFEVMETQLRTGRGAVSLEAMIESPHWPLLSMLHYRNHRNKEEVHSQLRGLLT